MKKLKKKRKSNEKNHKMFSLSKGRNDLSKLSKYQTTILFPKFLPLPLSLSLSRRNGPPVKEKYIHFSTVIVAQRFIKFLSSPQISFPPLPSPWNYRTRGTLHTYTHTYIIRKGSGRVKNNWKSSNPFPSFYFHPRKNRWTSSNRLNGIDNDIN